MPGVGDPCPSCTASNWTGYRTIRSRRAVIPQGLDRDRDVHVRVERCQNCELFRSIHLGDNRSEEELYAEDSVSFDASREKVEAAGTSTTLSRDEVDLVSTEPPARLLDIGCGAGQFLLRADQAGYDVLGIDIDKRAVEFVRNELDLEAHALSVGDLPEGESFDIITMIGVLEHLEDPVGTLEAVRTRLRDEGEVLVGVPNTRSLDRWVSRLGPHGWDMFIEPGHLYHYDPDTIKRVATRAGLSVVDWQTATIAIRGKIPGLPVRLPKLERGVRRAVEASSWLDASYRTALSALDALGLGDSLFANLRK